MNNKVPKEKLIEWINDNLRSKNGSFNNKKIQSQKKKKYDFIKSIIDYTSFLKEDVLFIERLYCIVNHIDSFEQILCPQCQISKRKFINAKQGYQLFCCRLCANRSEEQKNKIKKTCMEKYYFK